MADGIKKVSENVIIPKRALVITNPSVADNDAIEIGALQSNPESKGLKIKIAKNTYSLFDAAAFIMQGTITTPLLKDECVTEQKLGPKSVTEPKIADNAVSTRTVIDLNITEAKLAANSVTETKIANEAIINRHYKNKSITNDKIADNTIENIKLKDKTITNLKIANSTIIDTLIANKAIKNRHLDINSVNNENLIDASVYGNKIKLKGVEQRHLADNAVNTINILNGAVTGEKIPDKQIGSEHLKEQTVNTIHLANNSVTNIKLANLSVSTEKLVDKSVTLSKLGDDVTDLIGDPVQYDQNNDVRLRKNLYVNGDTEVTGTLTASRVYNATYMDLAEGYIPGEKLEAGDIVELRLDGKVYKASSNNNNATIVGVISNEYAHCLGATEEELLNGTKVAVGLIGKIHVKIKGKCNIGEKITVNKNGIGTVNNKSNLIVGKCLESKTTENEEKILCLIYPN